MVPDSASPTPAVDDDSAADRATVPAAPGAAEYRDQRLRHWDGVAARLPDGSFMGRTYHRRLESVYRNIVPGGLSVIELGCGAGDLLAAVAPARGVGVDFSPAMVKQARDRHPQLEFVEADVHDMTAVAGPFDVVILSDLINDLWDVQTALTWARSLCEPHTRIVLNVYSHLWELPLTAAARLRLATPRLEQNWLAPQDVDGLLALSGFDVVKRWQEVLCPLPIPLAEPVCNRYLAKLWPFRYFALSHFVVARVAGARRAVSPSVSVIVPARNEAGNVPEIFRRMPEMGSRTELVFVEGHSRDDTYDAIARGIAANSSRPSKLMRQGGVGKGDAVRMGFAAAEGDIVLILDADLTVPPEDLPRFVEVLESGLGEFVNGVRLVYPMQDDAMRFFNLVGNKFFSFAFSWLLGQTIKDTLCGTKVMWRRDYERIVANRSYFGDFDPFGDFDLLFGAARLGLRIVEMPVRYQARTYGETNIQRWRHGLLLLRMVLFAARRIKFV